LVDPARVNAKGPNAKGTHPNVDLAEKKQNIYDQQRWVNCKTKNYTLPYEKGRQREEGVSGVTNSFHNGKTGAQSASIRKKCRIGLKREQQLFEAV